MLMVNVTYYFWWQITVDSKYLDVDSKCDILLLIVNIYMLMVNVAYYLWWHITVDSIYIYMYLYLYVDGKCDILLMVTYYCW